MMRKNLALAIGLCMVCVLTGAETTLNETRAAELDGLVTVENTSGSVDIVGWDRPEIHLEGRLEKNVERVDFNVRDGRASIKVVIPRRPSRYKSAFLTLHVPEASRIESHTVSADFGMEGVRAALKVETVSGDVRIEMPKAAPAVAERDESGQAEQEDQGLLSLPGGGRPDRVRVESVSGDIRMEADADAIQIKTVSGDVTFSGETDELRAESVSGDQELSGEITEVAASAVSGDIKAVGVGRRAKASTSSGEITVVGRTRGDQLLEEVGLSAVSGDIHVKCALAPMGRMDLSTSSGEVEVRFTEEAEAEFRLETSSGDFDLDMGPVTMGGVSRREMRFSTGSGSGTVHIETTSGDISLERD